MFESKYSKVLTVILIIVIVAIVGLLGFLGYDYYQKYVINKDTAEYVQNFQTEIASDQNNNNGDKSTENTTEEDPFSGIQDAQTKSENTVKTYKGFGVVGTIEIPAIGIQYPILEKVTKKSIEVAVAFLYGTGINQPGNSVIIGHNYRNGLFFSNLRKLNNGDKIYITDNSGAKLTYTIYNKFEAAPEDTSFYQRDTGGKPEITLSTCTDNVKTRLIIFARAD